MDALNITYKKKSIWAVISLLAELWANYLSACWYTNKIVNIIVLQVSNNDNLNTLEQLDKNMIDCSSGF